MEKRPNLHIDFPDLELDETEQTLVLPKQNSNTDEAAQDSQTAEFRTEEILTIIEDKISQEPKRTKQTKIKDILVKRDDEEEENMTDKLNLEDIEKAIGGVGPSQQNLLCCPNCNSRDCTMKMMPVSEDLTFVVFTCNSCGTSWRNSYSGSHGRKDPQQ